VEPVDEQEIARRDLDLEIGPVKEGDTYSDLLGCPLSDLPAIGWRRADIDTSQFPSRSQSAKEGEGSDHRLDADLDYTPTLGSEEMESNQVTCSSGRNREGTQVGFMESFGHLSQE
jgi:hypothetical protein